MRIYLLVLLLFPFTFLFAQETQPTTTEPPLEAHKAPEEGVALALLPELDEIEKTVITSVQRQALETHLHHLASDALEGRGSATTGERLAGDYLAKYFEEQGLKPYGDHGTYFQSFDVTVGSQFKAGNHLLLEYKKIQSTFELEKDYVPFSFSSDQAVEGEVVFAGYGITNEEASYDDYSQFNVEGKIVLLFRREPTIGGGPEVGGSSRFGDKRWSEHASFLSKVRNAEAHKAVAVLIFNDPSTVSSIGDDLLSQVGGASVSIPCIHLRSEVGNAILMAQGIVVEDLQKQINDTLKPRSFLLPGMTIRLQAGIEKIRKEARNIVAYLEGTSETNEYVILGAHYDHLGIGKQGGSFDRSPEGKIHNGADDNASGTSALLALAHALSKASQRPRSILFLAFSGEELGLLGSAHYVAHPTLPLKDCYTMINLDMVGRLSPQNPEVEVTGVATGDRFKKDIESLNQRVSQVVSAHAENEGQTLHFKAAKGFAGNSDHASFYHAGVPVLFFFTGLHKDYHRPSDDSDKINYQGLSLVTQLVALQTLDFLKDPQRPVYQKVKTQHASGSASQGNRVRLGIMPQYGEEEGGLGVTDIIENTPASRAGIQGGDRIIQMGSQKIQNIYDFMDVLSKTKPGDKMEIHVLRQGETVVLQVEFESK